MMNKKSIEIILGLLFLSIGIYLGINSKLEATKKSKQVFTYNKIKLVTNEFVKTDKLNDNSVLNLRSIDNSTYLLMTEEEAKNYRDDFSFYIKEKEQENNKLYKYLKKEEQTINKYKYIVNDYSLTTDNSSYLFRSYLFNYNNKYYEILTWTKNNKLDLIINLMSSIKVGE